MCHPSLLKIAIINDPSISITRNANISEDLEKVTGRFCRQPEKQTTTLMVRNGHMTMKIPLRSFEDVRPPSGIYLSTLGLHVLCCAHI
jgi:hypothetical protein